MRLKTPDFWYNTTAPQARMKAHALIPAMLLYKTGYHLHQSVTKPFYTDIPVICIGNIVAGGSGKTPVALSIMSMLSHYKKPCFLTRGYGSTEKGPLLVDSQKHTAAQVGDEPLLLSKAAPVIVSARRDDGARYAQENGFDAIVMDDGLQNPTLHKTKTLVVIDGNTGFGNGKMLPAGPLREPLETGIARTNGFVIIGPDKTDAKKALPANKPLFTAKLNVSEGWKAKDTPYVAFCGLGQPDKFRQTLEQQGIKLAGWHSFPDHYRYTEGDLLPLIKTAEKEKARLITTEKDAQRLPTGFAEQAPLDILPVRIQWDDEASLRSFLKEKGQ